MRIDIWGKFSVVSVVLLMLAGCAGYHTLPDESTISGQSPHNATFSVAFDQDGHIYPAREWSDKLPGGRFDWHDFHQKGKNVAFSLNGLKCDTCELYNDKTDERLTEEFSRLLNQALVGKKRLIVLIHGFNQTHEEAKVSLQTMQASIDSSNAVVLRVYWDGLNGDGKFFRQLPFRWSKSMVYGNLAGQVGLRRILNDLNSPVDIIFLTHSRGAAVAMSSLFEPSYDSHITAPGGKVKKACHEDYEPADFSRFNSVTLAMLAPAIGGGHFNDSLYKTVVEVPSLSFHLAVNVEDDATCKFFWPKRRGDSRLGCTLDYVEEKKDATTKHAKVGFDIFDFAHNECLFAEHEVCAYLTHQQGQNVLNKAGLLGQGAADKAREQCNKANSQ